MRTWGADSCYLRMSPKMIVSTLYTQRTSYYTAAHNTALSRKWDTYTGRAGGVRFDATAAHYIVALGAAASVTGTLALYWMWTAGGARRLSAHRQLSPRYTQRRHESRRDLVRAERQPAHLRRRVRGAGDLVNAMTIGLVDPPAVVAPVPIDVRARISGEPGEGRLKEGRLRG